MKLRSTGRGGGYSVGRGLLESILRFGYVGDWPARLWGALPLAAGLSVTRHSVELPPGPGTPCRVAFISDLHVGPTTPMPLLLRSFDRIREERPDVLLLGGDYVFLDAEPRRLAILSALIASVRCSMKLAVLGNHDLWTDDQAIVRALEDAGARVLVNETSRLPAPWDDVAVIGLDDPWTGSREAQKAFAGLDGEPFRLVLCHSPDGLLQMANTPFDLFLAGHTHGGHIAAPWGPIALPHGPLCRTYSSGFGRFNSGTVYVSRGIGGVEVPFRTFAPPDILLLELRRPARAGASGLPRGSFGPSRSTVPGH